MEIFRRHVALTQQLIRQEKYRHFIVGFDVAGNEAAAKPSELRKLLLPLLKECLHLTIHAGENQPVENIWEAVYELNTDRVGHGLTLVHNYELLQRFRDRNIVIELCPSSNFQICNFNGNDKPYPLRNYLKEGLKVTLNTDNPGISRTSITKEYFFMTQYAALTKLEVIQLLRNSLQGVFLPKNEKKQLIVKIEEEFYHIISNENQ
jgi:adenosine deaminase